MFGPAQLKRGRVRAAVLPLVGLIALSATGPVGLTTGAAAQPDPSGQAEERHVVPFPQPGIAVASPDESPATDEREPINVEEYLGVVDVADAPALHVKLAEGSAVDLVNGGLDGLSAQDTLDLLAALAEADASIEPLFKRAKAVLDVERLEVEAKTGVAPPDLTKWLRIELGDDPEAAAALLSFLNELPGVEAALPEPVLAPAGFVQPGPSPDHVPNQLYLNRAPVGIDADYAAGIGGGDGSEVTVADIEYSWNVDHEDVPGAVGAEVHNGTPVDPVDDTDHGTAVVGILGAAANGFGVQGAVPAAGLALVNVYNSDGAALAEAIDLAAASLKAGDVLLIEQQLCPVALAGSVCPPGWLPVEWWPSYYDAVVAAVARDIIVVEPAGNGSRSVDLELTMPDSGAIVVGAGNPDLACTAHGAEPARGRLGFSNHGARVDVQSHGACVWTTGGQGGAINPGAPANSQYTSRFSGTSAASAIVAGAAASLSSISIDAGKPLTPAEIRALLRSTGTPQDVTLDVLAIGPQPDLRAAIEAFDATAPTPPANDDFFSPTVLTHLPATITQSAAGATVQPAEPVSSCGSTDATVWFTFTASGPDSVDLSVGATAATPSLTLWQVGPGEELTEVGCRPAGSGAGVHTFSADLLPGRQYMVQVGAAGSGAVTLGIEAVAGGLVEVECDFNADGFADVLIGAPGETVRGRRGAGAVNVFYGHRGGEPDDVPVLHQASAAVAGTAEAGDRFGASAACGDINGDGFDDAAVGVPGEDRKSIPSSGAVHVFFGGAHGIGGIGDRIVSQATKGVPGKAERFDEFGAAVEIGDVDGDGFADVIVGAPGESINGRSNAGVVVVIPGSSSGLASRRATAFHQNKAGIRGSAETDDRFGAALAVADTNRDRYGDLYIGVPGEALRGRDAVGMVIELPGGPSGPMRSQAGWFAPTKSGVASPLSAHSRFGAALAIEDLNGDGYADLAVGAPGGTDTDRSKPTGGWVDVLSGSARGLGAGDSLLVRSGKRGVAGDANRGEHFGAALSAADFDANGVGELLVGVPSNQWRGRSPGAVVSIAFAPDFTVAASDEISQDSAGVPGAAESGDRFGAALTADDVNGDGYPDAFVGAPNETIKRRRAAGLALILPGSGDGLDLGASRSLHQGSPRVGSALEAFDRFGSAFS